MKLIQISSDQGTNKKELASIALVVLAFTFVAVLATSGISSVLRVSPTLRTLTYIHAEHHNLGGHGGHLIGEAVLVNSVHMSSKGVFSIGFSLPLNCSVKTVNIGIERSHFIPDEWSSHLDLQF